jgi:hypothetical protein
MWYLTLKFIEEKWVGRVGLQMRLSSPFLWTKTKQNSTEAETADLKMECKSCFEYSAAKQCHIM